MQEFTVHSWCDRHWLEKQEKLQGEQYTVADAAGNLVALDLCPQCADDLLSPLLAVVDAAARPLETVSQPGPAARRGRPPGSNDPDAQYVCPICRVTMKNVAAQEAHFRNVHNVRRSEVYGGTCPLCGESSKVLGAHAKHHDEPDVAKLFDLAHLQGDPLGVVAERRRAWAGMR